MHPTNGPNDDVVATFGVTERLTSEQLADEYGRFDTLADLFRQIGDDERVHKLDSIEAMERPRFD